MTKKKKWIFAGMISAIFICTVSGLMSRSELSDKLKPENEKLILKNLSVHQKIKSQQTSNEFQSKSVTGETIEAKNDSNLALLGVMASGDGEGYALIEVAGKAAQPFAKGDRVVAGFVIHSIQQELVKLAESQGQPVIRILRIKQKIIVDPSHPGEIAPVRNASNTTSTLVARPIGTSQNLVTDGPPPREDSRYKPSGPSRRHDVIFYKGN